MVQRIICLILIALSAGSVCLARDKISVWCTPKDAYSQLPIKDVKISIADTAGVVLLDSLSMSVRESYRQAYDTYTYSGYVDPLPKYRIEISAKGYETQNFVVEPIDGAIQLGGIYLRPPQKEMRLNEVTVTATKVKMVMKGDTIEYDASAFKLPEGSMLDVLIAALPGTTLNDDGQISVNGRFVSELLVNGRSFFEGDPQMALRNLPSYTVKNVQVYQKTPEQFRGQKVDGRDRTNDPLVMDVNLKPDYMNGWIANAEGGYGSTLDRWSSRWMGRLFAMRYDKFSYLALQASANNLNDAEKAGSKGQWSKPSPSEGLRTSKRASLEYNTDWHDQRWNGINTTFDIERLQRIDGQSGFSEQFLPEGNVFMQTSQNRETESWSTKWRGEISRMKKGLGRIWFTTGVQYTKGNSEIRSSNEQWTTAPVYSRIQNNNGRDRKFTNNWSMYLSSYLPTFFNWTLNATGKYNNAKVENSVTDQIYYPAGQSADMLQLRRSTLPTREWEYMLWPYFSKYDFQMGGTKMDINGGYQFRHSFNSGRRNMQEITDTTGVELSSVLESGNWAIDEANSYHTVRRNIEHEFSLYLNFQFKHDFAISGLFEPHLQLGRITDLRNGESRQLHRSDWLLNGRVSLGVSHGWDNGYGVKVEVDESAPDMLELLDVKDSSNPLIVRYGNSKLKKSTELSAGIYYEKTLRDGSGGLSFEVNYGKVYNALGVETSHNLQTGVVSTRPENLNGNWSLSGDFKYSGAWLPGQALSLTNTFCLMLNHSVDFAGYYSDVRLSAVDNLSLSDRFEMKYEFRRGMLIKAKADLDWRHAESRNGLFAPFSTTDVNYGVGLMMPVVWGVSVDTDLMAYSRTGYSDRTMNRTDIVWNLQLSKTFGSGGRYTVKLIGFDLLQQLPSIKQVVNAQGRYETRYNSQPSYGLITFSYRLDVKPKKKSVSE